MMKLRLVIVLLLLWLAPIMPLLAERELGHASPVPFSSEELQFIRDHRVVIVGGEMDWPPFDYVENERYTGMAKSYLDLLGQITGIEFKVVTGYRWDELLQLAREKKIDMLPILFKSDERSEYLHYTDSYLTVRNYVFTRSNEVNLKRLDDLKGRTVVVPKGYGQIDFLHKEHPEIGVLVVDTPLEAIDAVVTSRADALIENTPMISYLTKQNNIQGLVAAFPSTLAGIHKLHMATRKDWGVLRDILNKALKGITREQRDEITRRWATPQSFSRVGRGDEWKSITLDAIEVDFLTTKQSISACVDPAWMPLEGYEKGEHTGISSDYRLLFSQMIDTPISVVATESWMQSLEFVRERRCDLLLMSAETPLRREYLNFTTPYMTLPLMMATREESWFFSSMDELAGKRIGIVEGYALIETIQAQYPDVELVFTASIRDGLQQVAKDELFGFIDTLPTLGYLIQSEFTGELKIGGKFDIDWKLGVGVRNDEPLLLHIFNKAVNAIPEGKRREILNNWISITYQSGFDYSLMWKIVAAFALILAVLLYRNRELTAHRLEIAEKNLALEESNRDLSLQKEKIRHLAYHDALTGLLNRRSLVHRLDQAINLASHHNTRLAVLFMDLDRFKLVNDTLGHPIGDEMLKVVSGRLKLVLRESDIVVRVGGDEFVVMLEGVTKDQEVALVANKILTVIKEPMVIQGHLLNTSTSIGIALYPEDGERSSELLKSADSAMYLAKGERRGSFQFHTHS
ncbi:MAG: transporter substrate-binding domain-containing protein [Candidatus Sedimenticola sp. (ex Thyasira tokunagai)]